MMFEEKSRKRVYRDASFQLREENGRTVLGPVPGEFLKKYAPVIFVAEGILFAVLALVFMIGFMTSEDSTMYFIVLFFLLGTLQLGAILGLGYFAWSKVKRGTRWIMDSRGRITLRDASDEEIRISRDGDIDILCTQEFDQDGREIYDIALRQGRETYYILSGTDRDDMERLRQVLQNLCQKTSDQPRES